SRSSYPKAACKFTGSRTAFPAYIRSAVTRYVLFVSYAATTSKMPTYSFPSAAGQSVLLASTASSSASARLPRCLSPSTPTCCAMLASDGHDTRALQHYLGHKNIQYTVRYTQMAPDRFKDFWRG